MPDLRLILVDYPLLQKRYETKGMLGRGEDPILEIACQNWAVQDTFASTIKLMQIYPNLGHETFRLKLEQLNRSYFEDYVLHQTQLECISVLKKDERSFDLVIIYDSTLDDSLHLKTLEEELEYRRKDGQPGFQVQEVKNMVSVLCEQLFIGSKFSREYLCVSPANLFYQPKKSRQIVISNLNLKGRPRQIYHHPKDSLLTLGPVHRHGNALLRHQLFKIGMVGLECLSLANMASLYQEGVPQQHLINNLLNKYRKHFQENTDIEEGVKEQSLAFIDIIEQFVQVREERRLNLDDLMDKIYWRGELTGWGYYQGYYTGTGQNKKPDGVGQCLIDGWVYKGQFVEGQVQGRGIIHKGDVYISGLFQDNIDTVTTPQILHRGHTLYVGEVQAKQKEGQGVQVVLSANTNDKVTLVEGLFQKDNYVSAKSKILYRDGRTLFGGEVDDYSQDEDDHPTRGQPTNISVIDNNSQVQQNNSQVQQNNSQIQQNNSQVQQSQVQEEHKEE